MVPLIFKWLVISIVLFASFLLILMAVGTTIRGVKERKKLQEEKKGEK